MVRRDIGRRFVGGSVVAMAAALALASCAPAETATNSAPPAPQAAAAAVPQVVSNAGGPVTIRRLTQTQYRNIIGDVFGPNIELGGRLEPDIRVEHLIAVGASEASVTEAGLGQYDKMGRTIASQVVDEKHRGYMIPCKPVDVKAADEACTRMFLTKVGELLFRRPLSEEELKPYLTGATVAAQKTGSFYDGLSLSLAGLLTAPQFLYRLEAVEPDPEHAGQTRLTAYAKASRLSFFLWNTVPDQALLASAKSGEIQSAKGMAKQVDRMLASPRLEEGVRAFFADMLEFDTFDTLAKDAALYPKFTSTAAQQAQEQTLRTIVEVLLTENGDYRDIFTTRKTFLTPLLGSLYRVPVAAPEGMLTAWVPYEFSEANGQSGILTHVSFVALHSHPGRTSPTLRGKALREVLLCTRVPDPPGNVNFNIVQDTANPNYKTVRQRLTAHATEAMCTGCHKITDPMGLALENFDTIGGFRDTENGAQIDTAGELDGVKFTNALGLGKAVHDNPKATSCLVQRAYSYAVGRAPTKSEDEWRASYLEKSFTADGYRLRSLFRRIVTDSTFYRIMPATEAVKTASAESK